jgi:hypothetical protein
MLTDNFVQIGTAVMLTLTGEKKTEPLYTKADLLIQTRNCDGGNVQEDSAQGRRRSAGSVAQQPPTRAARAERGGVADGGSYKYYLPPCKSVNVKE